MYNDCAGHTTTAWGDFTENVHLNIIAARLSSEDYTEW